MDVHCSKCGNDLAQPWSFCPHCGAPVAREHVVQPPHEPIPMEGAFSGMALGMIAAPLMIVAGIMLCMTGWGLFVGVPVIIGGILAPLAGPIFGMGEHKGKCPSCGTRVVTIADGHAHHCPACSKEFAVEDQGTAKAQ
jgi:predicted amidophosphoribosyltransferase